MNDSGARLCPPLNLKGEHTSLVDWSENKRILHRFVSSKSWFVCICHAVSLYEESFCVQWLRATALRREPSPAWPWQGWASSPPTWCWLASRQTGWATCWRQSSTSLSFKEHLISILLWGFLGNLKSQWCLLSASAVYVTHQCLSRVRNGLDFSEHFKAEETLQGDAEGAVSCFPPLKGQIYFLLDWGKYFFLHIMTGANIFPLQLHWCRIFIKKSFV